MSNELYDLGNWFQPVSETLMADPVAVHLAALDEQRKLPLCGKAR